MQFIFSLWKSYLKKHNVSVLRKETRETKWQGKEKEIRRNVKFVSLQVQNTLNILLLRQLDTKESTERLYNGHRTNNYV